MFKCMACRKEFTGKPKYRRLKSNFYLCSDNCAHKWNNERCEEMTRALRELAPAVEYWKEAMQQLDRRNDG
jgi:hypothetical protein